METPIIDTLSRLNLGTRFHMPGHKGRLELFGSRVSKYDITELPGTDNLLVPTGAIARSQRLMAQETGAAACFYSVNGSTAGILASVMYAASEGDKLIISRDFHMSALSAMVLSGAQPVYVPYDTALGQMNPAADADAVCAAIYEEPFAKAVLVTSPNYYGMCANIEKIAKVAHKCHMTLIVDAAHGAHFPYSNELPKHPGELGADIWITSAHKTLPALNQCAVVSCGKSVDAVRLKRCLNMVQTTSPSYLLLASMDHARAYMAEKGSAAISLLKQRRDSAGERIGEIEGLRVETTDDFTRLVIDVSGRGITGFRAARSLAENGVHVETADERRLVLITTVCDMQGDLEALVFALKALPKGAVTLSEFIYTLGGGSALTPREAMNARTRTVKLRDAEGHVSAASVFAYPPGIPIIVPGQTVDEEQIALVEELALRSYELPGYDGRIDIVAEG